MRGRWRPIIGWATVGFGTLILVAALWEFLQLADKQQELGFGATARLLRIVVFAEVVVLIAASAVLLRASKFANRIMVLGVIILTIAVVDTVFATQATIIP